MYLIKLLQNHLNDILCKFGISDINYFFYTPKCKIIKVYGKTTIGSTIGTNGQLLYRLKNLNKLPKNKKTLPTYLIYLPTRFYYDYCFYANQY